MSDPTQTSEHPPSQPNHSPTRRVIKWLAILGTVVMLAIGSLGLALTYLFPSELVREELERRLAETLNGRTTIASLSFNALTGLELRRVTVRQRNRHVLSLHRLNLDYSLLGLFSGTLLINEVLIDRATVNVNLQDMMPPSEPTPSPQPKPEPTALPGLPLTIDLQALIINDAEIDLRVSPNFALVLTDLNLDLSGSVGKEHAILEGALSIADAAVDVNNRHIQLPVQMEFSLDVDLPSQNLTLQHLAIESSSVFRTAFSGHLQEFLATPKIDLTIQEVNLDIQPLLTMTQAFLPPDAASLPISGTLALTGHIAGVPAELGFQGVVDLTLTASSLKGELPPLAATFAATQLSVRLGEVNVRDNLPQYGKLSIMVSGADFHDQNIDVDDVHLDMTSEYFAGGPLSGSVETSGTIAVPPMGSIPALTLPFAVQFEAHGNHKAQELTLKNLAVTAGELLALHVKGKLRPSPAEGLHVSLATRVEPRIAALLPLLPPSLLNDMTIKKGDGSDVIVLNLAGVLDPEYRLQTATMSAGLKLTQFATSLSALPARATLDHMNALISADYRAQDGRIQGTVGSRVLLSDIHQGGGLTVGQAALTLKSHFNGTLDPAFALDALQAHDTLKIDLHDAAYEAPSVKVDLDRLTIKMETVEDVLGQHYRLKRLHLDSDPLIELTAQGSYRANTQQFDLAVDLSHLNLGELSSRVSGELVRTTTAAKPRGTMELTLTASGRVPTSSDLEQRWTIPIHLDSLLTLTNVSGAYANHRVRDIDGSIALSFQPKTPAVAAITTDLHVADLFLSDLPIAQASDAFVNIHLVARDFDELQIDSSRVGIPGAQVRLHGTLTGLKPFFSDTTSMASGLEQLFARLSTTATVDLARIQDLVAASGMKGSGTAQVNFSVLKKERGPLEVKLDVGANDVHFTNDNITVTDLDGSLSLQKRLNWKVDSSPRPTRPFNPSDVLSQLRALGGKGKQLTIRRIDLGFLTLANFSANLLFDQSVLKIQNLATNLLGGGLGGNIIVMAGKPFGISAHLEAAHLDFNELVDARRRIPGDSRIDAAVNTALTFDEQTGALDLGQTIVNVHITHIGREALDRLLVFLDPEGRNPTLMAARAQVRLANPSKVTIRLARGLMGLNITFSEGLLSSFTMNRIPIGSLAELPAVTQQIPQWNDIVQTMALIGASTYGIDADGRLSIE